MLAGTRAAAGGRKMIAPLWSRHDAGSGPAVVSSARQFGKRVQSPTTQQATNKAFAFLGRPARDMTPASADRDSDNVTKSTKFVRHKRKPVTIAGPVCWLDPRMRSTLSKTFDSLESLSAPMEEEEEAVVEAEAVPPSSGPSWAGLREEASLAAPQMRGTRTTRGRQPPLPSADSWRRRSIPLDGLTFKSRRSPASRASVRLATITEGSETEDDQDALYESSA
jgi:hypothetical protein